MGGERLDMEILVTIGYICICVLMFSLAIAIHEFGHFIVALKLGLNVERFSIGFGPAIWKKTWRGVEYRLSWIPLGGYVSIPDVDPEGTKALEGAKGEGGAEVSAAPVKSRIPAWKELVVAVAGPAMNIVLAVVLAFVLAAVPSARFGERLAKIDLVLEGSAAEKAGVLPGDQVIKVGDHEVRTWTEMQTEVQLAGGKPAAFVVDRGGTNVTLSISAKQEPASGAWFIMAFSTTNALGRTAAWMPSRNPLKQLQWDTMSIVRVLQALATPKEAGAAAKALGGPVMIAEGLYNQVRRNVWDALGFLRFLCVNLAILNLLPIPVLDGGLILFALYELLTRRKVPRKLVDGLSQIFMWLFLGLMIVLVCRDVSRSRRMHKAANEFEVRSREEAAHRAWAESFKPAFKLEGFDDKTR